MVYQCGLRLAAKVEVWWSKSREEPWRAQAASPRQSRSSLIFRGNRVDTIFRAGLPALLFFHLQFSFAVRFPLGPVSWSTACGVAAASHREAGETGRDHSRSRKF